MNYRNKYEMAIARKYSGSKSNISLDNFIDYCVEKKQIINDDGKIYVNLQLIDDYLQDNGVFYKIRTLMLRFNKLYNYINYNVIKKKEIDQKEAEDFSRILDDLYLKTNKIVNKIYEELSHLNEIITNLCEESANNNGDYRYGYSKQNVLVIVMEQICDIINYNISEYCNVYVKDNKSLELYFNATLVYFQYYIPIVETQEDILSLYRENYNLDIKSEGNHIVLSSELEPPEEFYQRTFECDIYYQRDYKNDKSLVSVRLRID